ncbi:MAG TPA: hypothetical protein VF440_13630 [Novosphingobium sp.]
MAGAAVLLVASLAFVPIAEIRGETVRLGDVADISVLPSALRAEAAALPLARLNPDAVQASVPHSFLAAQARSRLPALAAWIPPGQSGVLALRRHVPASMPRARGASFGGVAPGEPVALTVQAGGFRIERAGRALSAARPGERLFVRTADRQVLAAVLEADGQ